MPPRATVAHKRDVLQNPSAKHGEVRKEDLRRPTSYYVVLRRPGVVVPRPHRDVHFSHVLPTTAALPLLPCHSPSADAPSLVFAPLHLGHDARPLVLRANVGVLSTMLQRISSLTALDT